MLLVSVGTTAMLVVVPVLVWEMIVALTVAGFFDRAIRERGFSFTEKSNKATGVLVATIILVFQCQVETLVRLLVEATALVLRIQLLAGNMLVLLLTGTTVFLVELLT